MTYTIKPLEWKENVYRFGVSYTAETPWNTYDVGRRKFFCRECGNKNNCEAGGCGEECLWDGKNIKCGQWHNWEWEEACGDGAFNYYKCATLEEGKQLATAHWEKRLKEVLEEVAI